MFSAITSIRMCMLLLLFFVANIINAQAWQKTDAGIETVINDIKVAISFGDTVIETDTNSVFDTRFGLPARV